MLFRSATKAVKDFAELKIIFQKFIDNNVLFTINTDWPEIIERAHLWKQYEILEEQSILSHEQLLKCNEIAFNSTFIKGKGLEAYL